MSRPSSESGKETSIFVYPLRFLTEISLRHPLHVAILAVSAAAFCLFFAYTDLKFKTSRLDLINQKSEFNKLWIDYIEDFGDADDLVVVVEGEAPEAITPVLDELSAKISEHPTLFRSVLESVDTTPLLRKGLHFIEKPGDLENVRRMAQRGNGIAVGGQWNLLGLDNYLAGLNQQLALSAKPALEPGETTALSDSLREIDALTAAMLDAFCAEPTFRVSPLAPIRETGTLGREYFIADGGRLGVVLLKIAESKEGSFTYGTKSIEKLREIIKDVGSRHSETEIGLTGLTVMENDEMRISQENSTQASFLSLIGVAIIFVAAFGGFRHAFVAVTALMVGIAWTMGFIVAALGHLNILSMSFGVILVGLGIDFGIHYISRYLANRRAGATPSEAMHETGVHVGPGVVIGALTTAAAFFMIGLSEFTGIAELGIVSGGGVLLCCLSAVILIPALIGYVDHPRFNLPIPKPVDFHSLLTPVFRYPKVVLTLCFGVTVFLAAGLPKLWYDHNLLNMQPDNLESVRLEKELLKKWDKGAWFALSIADTPEELLERKKEFEKDPTLRVDEIISRFPRCTPEKTETIRQIGALLADLPERPGTVQIADAAVLGQRLGETQELILRCGSDLLPRAERQRLVWRLGTTRDYLRILSADNYARRAGALSQRLAGEFLGRLHLLRFTASPEPPELTDLPESLVSRYVGQKSGKYLMRIYSVNEIWDMDKLKDFIARVKRVDPAATGNPIQTYEASLQMQRSYTKSAILALLAILPLIYLDFRSVRYTLLAVLPMGIGVIWAFGLMGLLNIPFNPANTIVVPLILGIGIDDGIHLVHDFRLQKGQFTPVPHESFRCAGRKPPVSRRQTGDEVEKMKCRQYKMSASLTGSILLTSLTTMIGFGSLMLADHRGLVSLGRVLVIGMASCLLTSLILMPALLTFVTRHRAEADESAAGWDDEIRSEIRDEIRDHDGEENDQNPARPIHRFRRGRHVA